MVLCEVGGIRGKREWYPSLKYAGTDDGEYTRLMRHGRRFLLWKGLTQVDEFSECCVFSLASAPFLNARSVKR